MKKQSERMGQDMKSKRYVIEEKTYVGHINDEVHLYGLLHQLAFLAGRVKDQEDAEHLIDTAKRYGEIADEKFCAWGIPGRYLVFGDKADLSGLMAKELCELAAYLAEYDAEKEARIRAQFSWDKSYIIPGCSFRLLVGDMFRLLGMYGSLSRRIAGVKNEKELARLQKKLETGNKQTIRGLYRRWGVPEDEGAAAYDVFQKAIETKHLIPITEDGLMDDFLDVGGDE